MTFGSRLKKISAAGLLALVMVFGACQPIAPPPATTTTTIPVTTTTPSSVDETPVVQAMLNGGGTVTINRAYRIDNTLNPPSGTTVNFGPSGKLVRTSAAPLKGGTNPVVYLGSGNVTLNNPVIVGSNPCYWTYFDTGYRYAQYDTAKEWHHAITIEAGSNYTINNPKISDVWGDAVNIDKNVSNITIRNLQASCLGRSVVSNTGSTNTRILGGSSYGAFWWTFNIEPFGNRLVKDYYVENFDVGWSRMQYIFAGGPDFNCGIQNVDFIGITFSSTNRDVSIRSCVSNQISY